MGGSRTDRLSRTARPTALLSAVATLLGALFICLGPAGTHHGKPSPRTHGPGATAAAGFGAPDGAGVFPATAYSCPYDDGGCGLLPVLSPAVLTVPPPQLDAPLEAGAPLPHPGPAADAGGQGRSGVLARAPDLHVLQVLRT
ncbi:hypothetical protein ACH46N_08000 [Streptomyces pristinaespiralis]|uniref:Uncharacterized protein n=1 Tax=Streptomyces pristinaespiralis TaxID=38300 RepID=A0A0M4DJ83_STRPR|nr:hypothetical protein [Streptomyces pristinaespiralis]ALC23572.1 hypothetical protein SPRI_5266 [Streptomyces pristinaespiralis]